MGRRPLVLAFIFSVFFVLLGFHLYKIQILSGSDYKARADMQNSGKNDNTGRGSIFFTDKNNGEIPAAISKDYPLIYAVPKEVINIDAAAEFLSRVSGRPSKDIKKMLANRKSLYAPIVEKANNDQLVSVAASKIAGIYSKTQTSRFYPSGELGAHVLGFVGFKGNDSELHGLYGIESFYEKKLTQDNDSVHLTIDRNVQAEAGDILSKLIKEHHATGGTVIVEEPQTGKIVAMENEPAFDPSNYKASSVKFFTNPSIQALYEPGSVMKVITMAVGFDANKLTPDTTYVDKGEITLNGKTIKNWDHKSYGRISMTTVIENSVNTGAVFAEHLMGHDIFLSGLSRFGFGKPTGINLPGELSGSLRNLQKKGASEINFATASFGQGISVTPLQLVNAVSAIANHGVLMRPYITADLAPQAVGAVVRRDSAEAVIKMMTSAVDKAEIASIKEYSLAGKTGTAEVPDFIHGGYSSELIHSYAGIVPANDPKFVILIKLDKPRDAGVAALTVVPAFREMAQFILNYYNIPPDRLSSANP